MQLAAMTEHSSAGNTLRHINRILVVDDAEDILELARLGLEMEGWTVHAASTGAGALEAVRGGEVQVVLLDMDLPDCSGGELLTQLLEIAPDLKIIAFTASTRVEGLEQLAGTIGKPFDPLALSSRVRSVL